MENREVFTFTGGPPPNWLESHSWYAPVQVAPAEKMPLVGLKKLELKMAMCCMKCAEIISEELREVPGVMDVIVDYKLKKVTVIGAPFATDVLKRAKKVDRKATWWPVPPAPPPKEEKKVEKKVQFKEEKKVEKKVETKEEKKEEKKEDKKEDKKEEKKKEDKKEEKKDEKKKDGDGKGKGEPAPVPAVTLQQYPPFDYVVNRYPWGDYHPSQAYNPLLPYNPYPYSHQLYYDWPHFRTMEGAEAAFVPPPKPVPYQNVGDLWSIFQPP